MQIINMDYIRKGFYYSMFENKNLTNNSQGKNYDKKTEYYRLSGGFRDANNAYLKSKNKL